jgi:hypothetical protein
VTETDTEILSKYVTRQKRRDPRKNILNVADDSDNTYNTESSTVNPPKEYTVFREYVSLQNPKTPDRTIRRIPATIRIHEQREFYVIIRLVVVLVEVERKRSLLFIEL